MLSAKLDWMAFIYCNIIVENIRIQTEKTNFLLEFLHHEI